MAVTRYVLSNGENTFACNYKNAPIYKINRLEDEFIIDYADHYASFFFNIVCGDMGYFYVLTENHPIPWRIDIDVSEDEKNIIERSVHNLKPLGNTEEAIVFKSNMIFQNSMFAATIGIKITSSNIGDCFLSDEKLILYRKDGKVFFSSTDTFGNEQYVDEEGVIYNGTMEEELSSVIPARIEPNFLDFLHT
jgi:hypothetical protein